MISIGRKDTLTKEYMSRNDIFADVFNYILYGNMEIDKNRLANENLHSSLRNYRYIPILIYILEKSYSSVFASWVTS